LKGVKLIFWHLGKTLLTLVIKGDEK